ncbi:MAG TPA: NAD(P)-dependent oxidoreductase [Burkholderiales bacterium]|nr:NAD(P)-dependent oxidoreductase [Burkholderiales bacterium]
MKIGFIGLGAMGRPMAANLQRAGHALQVYDLRRVADFPNQKGSVTEAAQGCELLFTSLPGPAEVEAIAAQAHTLNNGAAWFDLSTNSPMRVRALHKAMQTKGIHLLDAPVSGGPKGAQSGKLAIWVGGAQEVFERFKPVLQAIGDQVLYVGPIGAGTVAKLAHNAASFTIQAALAEVFTLGVKAGVEPLALYRALRQGATGRKRAFDRLAEHFLPGVYDPPAFTVRLAHKDMGLALELAREAKVPMKVGRIAFDELDEAMKRGWGERDCRVAMTLQEERADVSVRVPRERLENLPD